MTIDYIPPSVDPTVTNEIDAIWSEQYVYKDASGNLVWNTPSWGWLTEIFIVWSTASIPLQTMPWWTTSVFNTVISDVNGNYNNTTWEYTIPSDGLYQFNYFLPITAAQSGDNLEAYLYKDNGVTFFNRNIIKFSWERTPIVNTIIADLSVWDVVTLRTSNTTRSGTFISWWINELQFSGYKIW